jgi:hypothetical protein
MKRTIYLTLFLLTTLMAFSQSKTQQQALNEATSFMRSINPSASIQSLPMKAKAMTATATDKPPYYIFNAKDNKGFVIVSGDERTEQILGYSDKGKIDMDNMPDGLKVLLQQYAAEIKSLGSTTTTVAKAKAASTSTASATKTSISPLVESEWGQNSPYNDNCPTYSSGWSYGTCVTGCVATAMAQIMYYWGKQKGYNLSTTDIPAYTTLTGKYYRSALSATTFDWDSMTPTCSTSAAGTAVAKLMQYVGQSVRMDYGSSSNAWGSDVCRAYRDYLGFDKHTRDAYRQDYTSSEWDDLLYNEVAAGRPVEITGSFSNGDADKTWSGHSFVCDGYSTSNGGFHINWGWNGSRYDGYFKLSSLNPYGSGNYAFCIYENATIGIQPPVTGNVEEAESTRLTVADFVCSGAKSFTRENRYSDFDGISVFAGLFNHLQNPNSFDAAVGLYKGDELLKVMSIKRIGYYESEDGYGREQCFDNLSFVWRGTSLW